MKFKIGDKVKFLNTTGGGVISRIIDKSLVHVEIEDGFEIPVMVSDLIQTGEVSDPAANMFRKGTAAAISQQKSEITGARVDIQTTFIPGRYAGKEMEDGLYLAYRPMDQRILTFGDFEVLLINTTGHTLSVHLYLPAKGSSPIFHQVELRSPESKILAQIPREALEIWMQGNIQFMVHPQAEKPLLLPVHAGFHWKPSRFFKADAYENTSLDPHKVICFLVKSLNQLQISSAKPPIQPEPVKIPSPQPAKPKSEPLIRRHIKPEGYAEVDLHIHALTDDHLSLNPMETLNYQMGYFNKVFDSALQERIPKLVVIHGVGNGILKAEVLKAVAEVDFAQVYDAPIRKYGVGATVIEFFHSKNPDQQ
ncbi:MAG: hypothetical protein R6V49_01260 [Bacteroidales bacterium]